MKTIKLKVNKDELEFTDCDSKILKLKITNQYGYEKFKGKIPPREYGKLYELIARSSPRYISTRHYVYEVVDVVTGDRIMFKHLSGAYKFMGVTDDIKNFHRKLETGGYNYKTFLCTRHKMCMDKFEEEIE